MRLGEFMQGVRQKVALLFTARFGCGSFGQPLVFAGLLIGE